MIKPKPKFYPVAQSPNLLDVLVLLDDIRSNFLDGPPAEALLTESEKRVFLAGSSLRTNEIKLKHSD